MIQETITKFQKLIYDSKDSRDKVRHFVAVGKWADAETDQVRKDRFILKNKVRNKTRGKESQVGDTLDWIGTSFLTEGSLVKQAVGYVTVRYGGKSTTGSGFMISDTLFMTNNHVIASALEAENALVIFNKENDEHGVPLQTTTFKLSPSLFFITSPEEELDFSLVHIGEKLSGNLTIEEIGHFVISDSPDKHIIGMNVNIIQHPLDLPKKIVFRNNTLSYRTDNSLLYETDTETGSSGSPVLNDDWDLIAIHHWGEPYRAKIDNPDSTLPNYVNEGIRISTIYKYLNNNLAEQPIDKKDILLKALSYAKVNPMVPYKIPMPRKKTDEIKNESNNQINFSTMEHDNSKIKIQIPLEITISLGNFQQGTAPSVVIAENIKSNLSEANKIDRNYENRSGYKSGFIKDIDIPLPTIKSKEDIAPLNADQINHKDGVLKYEHFSVVLNKNRRGAFYSATNIDGDTYKNINRTTGIIKDRDNLNQGEGETWYDDDRINPDYHLNQPFFSNWSNFFDRGHLTRRTDASWGTKEEAFRADADTFHFANCSIQHFRFNQTLKYWQGVERYILENGVVSDGISNKISVIQGPIYNDETDHWADDFQIPSKYFKIAVWRNKEDKLKSVGLVVDQSSLLTEERKGLRLKPSSSINVNEWRISIREIEKLTGLSFGDAILSADTISQANQPHVGAEAETKKMINSWEELLN
jgi:endonuclease G, mitochondrial